MQAQHNPDNLQYVREPQFQQTKRSISSAQALEFCQLQSLAVEVQLNFNSGATICHGVPHNQSQFAASPASFNGDSTLGEPAVNDDQERFLESCARKCTDTTFSNFTKPNFLSNLRHWLSPSSTGSPQFTRLSIFANSHLVHDLSCKAGTPAE